MDVCAYTHIGTPVYIYINMYFSFPLYLPSYLPKRFRKLDGDRESHSVKNSRVKCFFLTGSLRIPERVLLY